MCCINKLDLVTDIKNEKKKALKTPNEKNVITRLTTLFSVQYQKPVKMDKAKQN